MIKTILMYENFKLIKNLNSTVTKSTFILYVKFMVPSPGVCSCVCSACMYMDARKHVQGGGQKPALGVSTQELCTLFLLKTRSLFGTWDSRLAYTLQPASPGTLLSQLPQHWRYKCTPLCPAFKWVLWLKLRYSCLRAKARTMSTEAMHGVCIVLTALHIDNIGDGGKRQCFAYTLLPV